MVYLTIYVKQIPKITCMEVILSIKLHVLFYLKFVTTDILRIKRFVIVVIPRSHYQGGAMKIVVLIVD